MNFVKNDETLQGKLMRVEEHTLQKTTYIPLVNEKLSKKSASVIK